MLAAAWLVAGLAHPDGSRGLSREAAITLGVVLATVTLWVSRALPLSVTSLLAVGWLTATGVAGSFPVAAQGFAMDTIFFLLAANLMAQGIANAGLIDRIARTAGRLTGRSPARGLWLLTAMTGLTPLVMPSAVVRIKAFLPVARRLDELFCPPSRRGEFLKASGLIMSLLGPAGSIAVMTGGGMSIVAARTIGEFYGPINWMQWLLLLVPPIAVLFVVVSLYIQRRFAPRQAVGAPAAEEEPNPAPWSSRERFAAAALLGALTAWAAGTVREIPLALPAIFAAAAMALPPWRLVTVETIQRQRWDEILVVGSALSLSAALRDTGAIRWVAGTIFSLFPDHPGPVAVYGLTVLLGLLVRQLFLQPAPCMAITLPIVIEMARATGHDPLVLALLATGVIAVVQVLPVQSPPSLVCFSDGIFDVRDELRVVPLLIGATALAMVAAAVLYWPALRALGWV